MHHTKKLINSVERCVDESIEGFVTVNTGLRTLAGYPKIVVREDIDLYIQQGKVTTVTGGGSGHEPCFMGQFISMNLILYITNLPNFQNIWGYLYWLGFNNSRCDRLGLGVVLAKYYIFIVCVFQVTSARG